MLIDKEYIFHYDKTKSAWKNNSKIMEHDGMPCFAYVPSDLDFDGAEILFADGFKMYALRHELEEVNYD